MRPFIFVFVFAGLGMGILTAPLAASARNTEVILPVKGAVESDTKGHLLDVKFFMKGAGHPAVAKKFVTVSASRSTRGAFRSDEDSCNVAFLSSLRALQDRAVTEGGDAIIDIISVTRNVTTESETEFRCVAGSAVVHVALKGTIVKLK